MPTRELEFAPYVAAVRAGVELAPLIQGGPLNLQLRSASEAGILTAHYILRGKQVPV